MALAAAALIETVATGVDGLRRRPAQSFEEKAAVSTVNDDAAEHMAIDDSSATSEETVGGMPQAQTVHGVDGSGDTPPNPKYTGGPWSCTT